MLSIDQKAHILRRAGVAVPVRPERQMAAQDTDANACEAQRHWVEQVEALHARHALERATHSLHQAEASLQMGAMPHPLNRAQNT